MKKSELFWTIFLPIIGATLFTIGIYIGDNTKTKSYRYQAITHGCAQYDPQTGEWGWLPVTRETE